MQLIGGQAVLNGVMMKSRNHMAIAVRKEDKSIAVHTERVHSLLERHSFLRWPFIRGAVVLVETMVLGYRSLNISAKLSLGEEEVGWKETALTLVLAVAFTLAVFKLLPLLAAEYAARLFPAVQENYLLYNLVDGITKITLFVVYLAGISLLADVREVFRYHGSEHKAVNCHERSLALEVDNARDCPITHPRCGTTFVLVVLTLSVALYLFIPAGTPLLGKYLLRVALLPVVAGLSYEVIRIGARNWNLAAVRMLLAPGLAFQLLTTRAPRDDQLEVALAALGAVLELEKVTEARTAQTARPATAPG